jgi:hypothetical protein
MEAKIVKEDFKKLNQFMDGLLHSGGYVVRVGIMGQKNTRSDDSGQTNADIGFIHEYGKPATAHSPAIPERSFLRMPILFKSNVIIKETQQFIDLQSSGSKFIDKKPFDVVAVLTQLGIACERAILDAFDSRGFEKWKKNAPSTIARKHGEQPLIDLGFLRKSISSEVRQS